ncbi:MAG TPA: anti-sigma factor [Burkholderiales bacterium]|nr:anti-sigma factor [Burkholderiales bacterium]
MSENNAPLDDPELKALSQGLHQLYDPVLQEPVPKYLRAPRRRWHGLAIAASWVALGLGVGVLAGWQLHVRLASVPPQAEVPGFVKRAAIAHAVYTPEVRHPVEVGADQEQHLVAWLSKRLGAPLHAPKLDDIGYSLVGGRLLPGEGIAGAPAPVAQFMYQNKLGTRITLYVRANASSSQETAFRYAAEGNVKVFYWIDRKLGYALSSTDIGTDDLLKIANAVYQQLNP